MQNRALYILLGLVAAILLIRASVFTVTEGRLAIKSIGGEIVDSNLEPGVHFRIPLVHEVRLFDKRIITQLYPAERFLTREQEQLNVDFYVEYVKWDTKHRGAPRAPYEDGFEFILNWRL